MSSRIVYFNFLLYEHIVGVVTSLAGSGTGSSIDGIGTVAGFNMPSGIVFVAPGSAYVADFYSQAIRLIIVSSQVVTTFAGKSTIAGSADGTGTSATFNGPTGIGASSSSLFVTDYNNNKVRMIAISTGMQAAVFILYSCTNS